MNGNLFKFPYLILQCGAVPRCSYSVVKSGQIGRYDAEPYMRKDVRRRDVLPKNPNENSTLLDGADYTYLDGRPTPYGSKQMQRMEKQREYTAKIIQLTREVDTAKSIHKRHLIEREMEREKIIKSKLKPKGKQFIEF